MNENPRTSLRQKILDSPLFRKEKVNQIEKQEAMVQFSDMSSQKKSSNQIVLQNQPIMEQKQSQRGSYIPSSQTTVKPDHLWKLTGMMIIACLSPFYVGMTIFLSAVANYQVLQKYYNIPFGHLTGFSFVNGAVPLGGMLGTMLLAPMMQYTNKIDVHYIFFIVVTVGASLSCAPFFETLMIGRFMMGIVCAWENSMSAILIKDLTPVQYRAVYGSLYFTARIVGIMCSFIIGVAFNFDPSDTALCVINMIPSMITLLQLVLIKLFVPPMPPDLVAKNKIEDLRRFFETLYRPQKVQKALDNCIRQFKQITKVYDFVHNNKTEKEKEEANKIFQKKKNRAFLFSLHLSFLRQMCAQNYLTLYSKYSLRGTGYVHWLDGPLFFAIFQLIFTFLGLYLTHKFARKPLLFIGTAGVNIFMILVATFDFLENWVAVIVCQVLFLIFAGSMLAPVAWTYPCEMVPPVQIRYGVEASWIGAFILAIIPVRPQSYQFFYAISAYLFACQFINYFFVVETKNLTTRQVLTNYMQESYMELQKISGDDQLSIEPSSSEEPIPPVDARQPVQVCQKTQTTQETGAENEELKIMSKTVSEQLAPIPELMSGFLQTSYLKQKKGQNLNSTLFSQVSIIKNRNQSIISQRQISKILSDLQQDEHSREHRASEHKDKIEEKPQVETNEPTN